MRLLLILLILFVSRTAEGQGVTPKMHKSRIDGTTVTFTEFIEYMAGETGWVLITDVKVKFDQVKDKKGMDKWWSEGGHPITIKAGHVGLHNVEFDEDYWLVLRDIHFEGYLAFIKCKNLKIIIKDSRFEKPMRLNSNSIEFLTFDNCQFDLGAKIDRSSVEDKITFANCRFKIDSAKYFHETRNRTDFDLSDYMLQVRNTTSPVNLVIANCTFTTNVKNVNSNKKLRDDLTVRLNGSNFSGLSIYECTFDVSLDLEDSMVESQFSTNNCKFNEGLFIGGLSINQTNSIIDWESIKDYKLAILSLKRDTIFNGKNPDLFRNEENYANLISCYSRIFTTFRTQGNRVFANKWYLEWKAIETNQQTYKFEKTGDPAYQLLFYLNESLRIFCDYGTNPIKSLYNSGLVILIFALIFFIFHDAKSAGSNFYSRLAFFSSFHQSPHMIESLYEQHALRFQEANVHEKDLVVIRKNMKNLPFYYRFFSFYPSTKILDRLDLKFYKTIAIKSKSFNQLNRIQKFKLNSTIFFILSSSTLWIIFERSLSSVIISINAFSTLGFGEIRVKGWAIYLTVVEGFIGWFLLSLFSVSLLNQLLQ
jgi:hypothetical protein